MRSVCGTMHSTHQPQLLAGSQRCLLGFKPLRSSKPAGRFCSRGAKQVVRAQQQKGEEDGVIKVWVGRLAMIGFLSAVVGEFLTGKGALGQVGFITPNPTLAAVISVLAGGATFYATWLTIFKANIGRLDERQAARYAKFFGIKAEEDAAEVSEGMKQRGERGLSGENLSRNLQSGQIQTAADSALDFKDRQQADAAAADMKAQESRQKPQGPNQSLAAKADVQETQKLNFENEGLYYARRVELTNGRFAMIGFLTAIIIEAASGRGIISQCIFYLRLSGLLGEASGFR